MDFGGIIAGAMAGGGKAIQQNAQGQLEQQREKALAQLEQKMQRQNLDYEYEKKGEIAKQNAAANAAQSELEFQREQKMAVLESQLDNGGGGNDLFENAFERAADRTNKDYGGRIDVRSSSAMPSDDPLPEYNRMFAQNLRQEAEAVDDEQTGVMLLRLADSYESGAGQGDGNITSGGNDPLNLRN